MTIRLQYILIQASYLFLLRCGGSYAKNLIIFSQKCPDPYNGGEYRYYDKSFAYNEAKTQCDTTPGKLLMPTQTSWSESLDYVLSMAQRKKDLESVWVGVKVTKSATSGVIFTDADQMQLNKEEIASLALNGSDGRFQDLEGQELCIAFYPLAANNERFRPQHCVNSRTKAVCRCMTGLTKRKPTESVDIIPLNLDVEAPKNSQQSSEISRASNESLPEGRSAPGGAVGNDGNVDEHGNDGEGKSSFSSVTAILGVMLSLCVVATVYFLVRKRGKMLRDRISHRLPYNKPRPSTDGDSYRPGNTSFDESPGNHRPIHVYEEIFMRNSSTAHINGSPSTSNGFFINTLPHVPPPEPPGNNTEFVEIHEIARDLSNDAGYLRPSFHRPDFIPGDVRSPPPINGKAFKFHPLSKTDSQNESSECLLEVPHQELKYASVETVQTLLDGDEERDEEYFVDGSPYEDLTNKCATTNCTPVSMKSPKRHRKQKNLSPEFDTNRNSVANMYVDIKDHPEYSSPPHEISDEYQNDEFLKTAAKFAPKKPRRTVKNRDQTNIIPQENNTKEGNDNTVDYSFVNANAPLYSQVHRKPDKDNIQDDDIECLECPVQSSSECLVTIGYTPMANNATENQKSSCQIEVASYSAIPEINVQRCPADSFHNYEQVPVSSRRCLISSPVMLSTTNAGLNESSLACYEIPPEEYEQ